MPCSPLQPSFSERGDFRLQHIENLEIRSSIFLRKGRKRPRAKFLVFRTHLTLTRCFMVANGRNCVVWVLIRTAQVLRVEWCASRFLMIMTSWVMVVLSARSGPQNPIRQNPPSPDHVSRLALFLATRIFPGAHLFRVVYRDHKEATGTIFWISIKNRVTRFSTLPDRAS